MTSGRLHRVSTNQEISCPSPKSGPGRDLRPTRARVTNCFRRILMRVLDQGAFRPASLVLLRVCLTNLSVAPTEICILYIARATSRDYPDSGTRRGVS
jgi:hypothetical protein